MFIRSREEIYEDVRCPPLVDIGEWIAYNSISWAGFIILVYLLREDVAYLYDAIMDECTLGVSCRIMSAGIQYPFC